MASSSSSSSTTDPPTVGTPTENCEEKLMRVLSRPVELSPSVLSYLVTEWAALLSLPQGLRRPDLLSQITRAMCTALRAQEMATDPLSHVNATKHILCDLLDFALSVEADYSLRTNSGSQLPPLSSPSSSLSDPLLRMSSYPLTAHTAPPSRVLSQCNPRTVQAIAAWRRHMAAQAAPAGNVSKVEQEQWLMSFLDDGHGEAVTTQKLGAPVLRLRSPREKAEREQLAFENRRELCALVRTLLRISHSDKVSGYLRRQLTLVTSHDAPIMSCEQYLEVLPRLPMHDRDLFTRNLFSQNPVLLDLIIVCAESAVTVKLTAGAGLASLPSPTTLSPITTATVATLPSTATSWVSMSTAMAMPPLSHTLFSLLASAVASWSSPVAASAQQELTCHTEKVLHALRLCGYLPDPLGRFGEVLAVVPQKAVASVLKEYLVLVLGSTAEKRLRTDVCIKYNESSYAACKSAMAAAMNSVLEKAPQQFVAFFTQK